MLQGLVLVTKQTKSKQANLLILEFIQFKFEKGKRLRIHSIIQLVTKHECDWSSTLNNSPKTLSILE